MNSLKDLNIIVRILETRKKGQVMFRQLDFFGTVFYGVKVGAKTLLYKLEDFKMISYDKTKLD